MQHFSPRRETATVHVRILCQAFENPADACRIRLSRDSASGP
jgi:hypothetical protein